MSLTAEMRVGMSVYWVKITAERDGFRATWTQRDLPLEVWAAGAKREVLAEARLIATTINETVSA